MRDQRIANQSPRLILPCPESYVIADRERSCVEIIGDPSGVGVGVHLNAGKAFAECRLHLRSHSAVERLPRSKLSLNGLRVVHVSRPALAFFEEDLSRRRESASNARCHA